MKKARHFVLSLVLVATLLITSFVVGAAPANSSFATSGSYYDLLNTSHQKKLYQRLENEILPAPGKADVLNVAPSALGLTMADANTKAEELLLAMDAFLLDHPEAFWLNARTAVLPNADGTHLNFLFLHDDTQVTDDAGNLLVTQGEPIPVQVLTSNFTKERTKLHSEASFIAVQAGFHPHIKDQVVAAQEGLLGLIRYGNNTYSPMRGHVASGAFIEGIGFCEAYAKALKVILDKMGVPNLLVGGTANNGQSMEPHMWNLVRMDDEQWYAIDPTWNDSGADIFLAGSNTSFRGGTFKDTHKAGGSDQGAVAAWFQQAQSLLSKEKYKKTQGPVRELSLTTPTFPSITQGDPAPGAGAITIKNTALLDINFTVSLQGDAFTLLPGNSRSISAGETVTDWKVQPKENLGVGVYTGTVVVSFHGQSIRQPVSFVVNTRPEGSTTPQVSTKRVDLHIKDKPQDTIAVTLGSSGSRADSATIEVIKESVLVVSKTRITNDEYIDFIAKTNGSTNVLVTFFDAQGNPMDEYTTRLVVNIYISIDQGSGGSGSSGGSGGFGGGGGGGFIRQPAPPATDASPNIFGGWIGTPKTTTVLEEGKAKELVGKALQEEKAKDAPYYSVRIMGYQQVTPQAMAAMTTLAKEKNIQDFVVHFDQMEKGKVVHRISLRPATMAPALTENLLLDATTTSPQAKKVQGIFEKFFSTPVVVFGGSPTPTGILADFALSIPKDFASDTLVVHGYDREKNTYRLVEHWIDANGYLRFTGELSLSYVISQGPLEK